MKNLEVEELREVRVMELDNELIIRDSKSHREIVAKIREVTNDYVSSDSEVIMAEVHSGLEKREASFCNHAAQHEYSKEEIEEGWPTLQEVYDTYVANWKEYSFLSAMDY